MNYFDKHFALLNSSIDAIKQRGYYTPYPENFKSYDEGGIEKAKAWLSLTMNNNFKGVYYNNCDNWRGEEISPFMQTGIGVKYPVFDVDFCIESVGVAHKNWLKTDITFRAGILIEALERIKGRFFDIALATMHTTGQSFMMSFQASGPHANDRALEAIAMGFKELNRYCKSAVWTKNLGKFDLIINKDYRPVAKGIGLIIGCSTFPVWNSVPGIFANLITGNACIVKPHAKSILPIAIVVEELQKLFKENGISEHTVFLFTDSLDEPKTKKLAEHEKVKLIDYTGNSEFGSYIESLPKTTFTEKAGINSIILDSVKDIKSVCANIAFSASLYSGQMCTSPQNIFIPADGIKTDSGQINYEQFVSELIIAFNNLIDNPKAGPGTLGCIQNDVTLNRIKNAINLGGKILLESKEIVNDEFKDARIATPVLIEVKKNDYTFYNRECFGPILFLIKTGNTEESLNIAKKLASEKGALTCGAYTTDETTKELIKNEMNEMFVPVSFNFTGAGFINSHAAFSDFHLTGGNAAGNASFTNADFINGRIVWVGNRYM